ncbi:hypothetical protein ERO13_D13G237160v2 [Gossypium hirsutum]|nr:hypothetical protein ERO13_D13G237160v2 [Gossypium hirsutum]
MYAQVAILYQPQQPPPLALPSTPPAKTTSSSHPPHKCPMAETFYRSPAPGELPFAKVNACSLLAIWSEFFMQLYIKKFKYSFQPIFFI